MADNIILLENAGAEVRITLRKEQETPAILAKLQEVLTKHSGQTAVYLHLVGGGRPRVIKTEKKFWIEPTAAAVTAIEGLLGEGTVTTA